jgi:phosphatidylinositol glycan class O
MHSVDKYNEENIVKNLNNEFDLIVAHFLGLDHAGHKNNKVIKNPDLNDKLK